MLSSLTLHNFRSYKEREFQFSPGVTIITGSNGSGKTTILEAIYMVSTGSSFHGDDTLVISHGAPWSRVDMCLGDDIYSLKLSRQPKEKTLLKNNKPTQQTIPRSLLFEPEQLRILHGPPDLRRRWIDGLVLALNPTYDATLHGYARALRQRNALLRRGRFHKDDIFVWDVKLAEYGARIARERQDQTAYINKLLSDEYRRLSGQNTPVTIRYDTPFEGDYASRLLRALGERLESDIQRGFTGRGPHREDVAVQLGGRPVADVASRGERRTIYLATKLIELRQLQAAIISDQPPILLLDDVFAEFDEAHKELITSLDLSAQIIITSVDRIPPIFKKRAHHIQTS